MHHAVVKDPAVDYFMDEVNLRFYGMKKGQLYIFDAEFDELRFIRTCRTCIAHTNG